MINIQSYQFSEIKTIMQKLISDIPTSSISHPNNPKRLKSSIIKKWKTLILNKSVWGEV